MEYTNSTKVKFKKYFICITLLLIASFCSPGINYSSAEGPGKIVVANDDFLFTFMGFISGGTSVEIFANNVAVWFTNGLGGKFAVNNNSSFDSAYLTNLLNDQGYSWTYLPEFPSDLGTLLTYDGVFISGKNVDNELLIQYVNAGGNVYISGGAGSDAISEADQWKSFLEYFGLAFAPVSSSDLNDYNGVSGIVEIDSTHPVFDGVLSLYQYPGNDIIDLDPIDGRGEILMNFEGHGLYAVFDGSQANSDNGGDIGQEDEQLDSDNDGVPDLNDACPETSEGEIVDDGGCSINDLCPCDEQWKNHRSYVKCIVQASKYFESEGLIDKKQKRKCVFNAFKSRCGYKKAKFHWGHKKAHFSCDKKKAKFHWGHKK